jgi:predicted RNA-binding protein YlxR (DUF448 family)
VACREVHDRRRLWRIIRQHSGGDLVLEGTTAGAMGRSAYVCPRQTCVEEARRRKRLQRALRCPVSDSIYTALEERLGGSPAAASEAR